MSLGAKANPVTLRFRGWHVPVGSEGIFFQTLLAEVTQREVVIVSNQFGKVDVEIETGYSLHHPIPSYSSRLHRFVHSHLRSGIQFTGGKNTPNQQPTGKARYRIFWTGENERPPEGDWDAYLTFDQHSYGERNIYFPLWWMTSTDWLYPKKSPYLGKEIFISDLLSDRDVDFYQKKKFCVAFIGKAYPFRMHALTALSKIGKVDVFGGIARNRVEEKFLLAQDYRFVFAFENDLFPGYVTEKPFEAWATGAVPLYWGSDPAGYLNDNALINLERFRNLEDYCQAVGEVNSSMKEWENIASRRLLLKEPKFDDVVTSLRRILNQIVY